MSWHVRPACLGDLDAFEALAMMTGGGFTSLPQDRGALTARLARSDAAFATAVTTPLDELYILVLEQAATGRIGGTAVVFSRIGANCPFYSYKLGNLQQVSRELGRVFSIQTLNLTSDHDGASEVGGLFLHPDLRTGGLGRLLARSRYLFIAQNRAHFGDKLLAELRGVLDDDGGSPFWDGLGAKFFGMSFQEADKFNGLQGNQFIADLMPKHPVYTALLSDEARAVIGHCHPRGRPALAMLEAEGFQYDGYVDIFDGGPTVTARTDAVKTIRNSRVDPVASLVDDAAGLDRGLLAAGKLHDFRSWIGHSRVTGGALSLPAGEAELMNVSIGDEVRHVAF
ncbi:arginine N-succinyltransferase [Glacieibacterium sp.]|uniref:arginine N-succinyltransferase n=1 Tax=Glacieibacterium sp. TaxID=2860237 RepID=UPI003AFFAE65